MSKFSHWESQLLKCYVCIRDNQDGKSCKYAWNDDPSFVAWLHLPESNGISLKSRSMSPERHSMAKLRIRPDRFLSSGPGYHLRQANI